MNSYLFILSPPFSGSTALWQFVSTSAAVSSLPGEGQFLPEVKEIMRKDPWNPDLQLPWEAIKNVWRQYWDLDKPWLVEKSPPNLIRTKDIVRHFQPVHFLVMVRDPYAHCASLTRRAGWDTTRAAEFSLRCLRWQADNAAVLNNVVRLTYEQFSGEPQSTAAKLQAALPRIGDLRCDAVLRVHSSLAPDGQTALRQKITNHNAKAMEGLADSAVDQITGVLREDPGVMQYWGYSYYDRRRR